MLLAFKTQLKVNRQQREMLAKHAGVARYAWNWGLAFVQETLLDDDIHWSFKQGDIVASQLHKILNHCVKPKNPWFYEVSKCAPQQSLRDLGRALSDYAKGKKIRGKKVGFPKFKKKFSKLTGKKLLVHPSGKKPKEE